MQVLKDEIRKKILEVSRAEFIANGFTKTSMRTIASKANIGLSNIYNYFTTKNDIFCEIMAPVVSEIRGELRLKHKPDLDIESMYSSERRANNIRWRISLTKKYRNELRLLLFEAKGTSFENFREEFTDTATAYIMNFLVEVKKRYPELNTNFSEFFIHTMTAWELDIYGEIVTHTLSEEETEHFITEYIDFSTYGWKKIIDDNQAK